MKKLKKKFPHVPPELSYESAKCEAIRRFPNSPVRQADFMTGWMNTHGLGMAGRRFLRLKQLRFGLGRRSKRNW